MSRQGSVAVPRWVWCGGGRRWPSSVLPQTMLAAWHEKGPTTPKRATLERRHHRSHGPPLLSSRASAHLDRDKLPRHGARLAHTAVVCADACSSRASLAKPPGAVPSSPAHSLLPLAGRACFLRWRVRSRRAPLAPHPPAARGYRRVQQAPRRMQNSDGGGARVA